MMRRLSISSEARPLRHRAAESPRPLGSAREAPVLLSGSACEASVFSGPDPWSPLPSLRRSVVLLPLPSLPGHWPVEPLLFPRRSARSLGSSGSTCGGLRADRRDRGFLRIPGCAEPLPFPGPAAEARLSALRVGLRRRPERQRQRRGLCSASPTGGPFSSSTASRLA